MTKVKAILAHDDEVGIAKNGVMPWPHSKMDMKWFSENTKHNTVVMGSKTFYSEGMPKPLPNRYNVVLTSKPRQVEKNGAHLGFNGCVEDCINQIKNFHSQDIWIIGGSEVFKQSLHLLDEIRLTHIRRVYDCDTFIDLHEVIEKFKIYETWRHRYDPDIKSLVTFNVRVPGRSEYTTEKDLTFLRSKHGHDYIEKIFEKVDKQKELDLIEKRAYLDFINYHEKEEL